MIISVMLNIVQYMDRILPFTKVVCLVRKTALDSATTVIGRGTHALEPGIIPTS